MGSKITELLQALSNGVGLVYDLIYPKFQEILKKDLISNDSPTYRYRVRVAVDFLQKRNSESRKIGSSEAEQYTFLEEFTKYLTDKLASCTDEELLQNSTTSGNVSFLEEGFPIVYEGIVLRCSPRYAAINLVQGSSSNSVPEVTKEVVVQVPNDIPGFGIRLKIGDVLSLRFSSATNEEEHVSLKRCKYLTENETASVIEQANEIFDNDGASAALDAMLSCLAVWSFIVEESCKLNQEVAIKVLSFCCNIVDVCSEHRFKASLEKLLKPFVHVDSCFLTETLKQLVIKNEKDSKQKRLLVKFIHQVVKLYPDRCLTLIPILQLPCFTEAECNKEFWIRLLTSITPNIPRAFEVGKPDDLPWKVIPLIPLSKEVESYRFLKTEHLPKIREDERYDSVDQYVHTYFTLLREECFFKLKKGIQGVTDGKLDSKDITLYWVSFENIKFVSTPYVGGLSLSLKVDNLTENSESQSKANIDWESKEFLKVGNLVCLSLDRTFRQPVWAYVSLNDEKERGCVSITMFNDRNMKSDLDMADIITKLHELKGKGVKAFMAESQTFYTAFGHTMKVLQERDKIPFEDCLVEAKTPGPAHYIEKAQFSPDWSCIFPSSKEYPDQEGNPQYDLLKDFYDKKKSEDTPLDETQLAAIEVALKHKLALIQGPPGTGKTYVGLNLLKILHSLNVKQGNNLGPILIVTYKNLALNQFLTKCLEMLPKNTLICRVGKNWDDMKEGTLKECRIFEISKKLKVKRRSTKEIGRQIEELKMQLLESCNKLKMGNKFTANVFMEEAEKQTIFWMLVGNGDDIQRAEAQNLVYNNAEVVGRKELLEMHITSLLKKWLPKEGKVADALEDNLKIHIKSDNNEAKEDIVGSCVEALAEEKERLGALGDDDSDDQEVAEGPQQHSKNREPEWGQQLLPLPDETIERYNNLLNTVNPWELEDDERIKFAHVLLKRFRDKAKREFLQLQREYIATLDELILSRSRFDAQVLKKCHIIGMTVTGATMRSDILASVKPRIMIVEEAAEVLEADLLAAIPLSVEHLIMIGDQKQLKPQVHHPKLRKECHMDLSMFERLAKCKLPLQQLGFQRRMRSEFAELLNKLKLYKDLKTNEELDARNNPPDCIKKSMFFQTHTKKEEDSKDSHSKCNKHEVVLLTKVATHLCENEFGQDQITVLCSYRGQVILVKKEFERKSLNGIEVTTIDSFQGQEQDIILLSLVRSGGNIGYLSSPNRLCVAISRARRGMYLFGNDLTLSKKSSKWKVVIGELRKQKMIGNKFPFGPPEIEVKTPKRIFKEREVKGGIPDSKLLQTLAQDIIKPWKKLGRALDLNDSILDAIEEQEKDPYERAYKMLKRWKESKGSEATFEALRKGLIEETVKRKDLAEKYCYVEQDKDKQTTCSLPTPILESQAGEERKPIQTASQAALTGATDKAMTPTQVQEENSTPESRNQSVSACVSANIGIARGKSKDGSTDKDVTVVPAEEVGSKSIAADDKGFQDKEDPVQESQQPHVKGEPHEEVGELTEDAKKPRTESGQS